MVLTFIQHLRRVPLLLMDGDTLSLPYTQGTDLSVWFVGWSKPSLPLSRRPPRVVILCVGGYQTRRCCRINLLVPHACAAASGARAIGDLEPRVNAVRNCCALCRAACNFLRVAAQVGYMLGWSCEGRGRVRWCQEHGRAARSSLKSELGRGNSAEFCLGSLVFVLSEVF